jgi:hypothetical protein
MGSRSKPGKLYLPAVQRWVADQTCRGSKRRWMKVQRQVRDHRIGPESLSYLFSSQTSLVQVYLRNWLRNLRIVGSKKFNDMLAANIDYCSNSSERFGSKLGSFPEMKMW